MERFASQAGVEVHVEMGRQLEGLDANEQIVVYRTVQESLSNIARHAEAHTVDVAVTRRGSERLIMVSDDGADIELRDEEDDLLRAAEELGIELSGVRAEADGKGDGDGDADKAKESKDGKDGAAKKGAKTKAGAEED